MSIISAVGLKKEFADRLLFENANFSVEKGNIIGLIGANGCGKTTLFKIIIGSEEPSGGSVVRAFGKNIGYLDQFVCKSSEKTAYEETLSVFCDLIETENLINKINHELTVKPDRELIEKQTYLTEKFQSNGGLTYKSRTMSVLTGLGLNSDETMLPVSALSGGQRSKIGLAKLLLCNNDLILLDEPTNHLDIDSITWLEGYLSSYGGCAIIISHDRYFLDRVTNKTMEIENKKIYISSGNYTRYNELKKSRSEALANDYEKKVKEIKRIEGIIEQQRRWNKEKNIKTAESKQKQIERIEKTLVKPESENHNIRMNFTVNCESGSLVAKADNDKVCFGSKTLYENISFTVRKNERVCLIGPNGIGKTTFLKRLISNKYPESLSLGYGVTVGYFDQFHSDINERLTPFDEIQNSYPGKSNTEVRNALAAFEFTGDDVFKSNSMLSGGERAKVALCRLMLTGKNFLVLDEPTNHLDVYARAALEEALSGYNGTLLIVSHDRYFINKIATKVVYFTENKAVEIQGNYDDYIKYLEKTAAQTKPQTEKQKSNTVKKGKEAYINSKKRQSDIRKLRTAVLKSEKEIDAIEEKISFLKEQIENCGGDYKKLTSFTEELNEQEKELEIKMNEWEENSSLLAEYIEE